MQSSNALADLDCILALFDQPISLSDLALQGTWLTRVLDRQAIHKPVDQESFALFRQRLEAERAHASTTLASITSHPAGVFEVAPLHNWLRANELMVTHLQAEIPLSWKTICAWHAVIVGTNAESEVSPVSCSVSCLRTEAVFSSGVEYPSPVLLESLKDEFERRFLSDSNASTENPLRRASQIYQWFVSAHFFNDGNGRIGRLLADRELMRADLFPMSFRDDRQAFVSLLEESGSVSPMEAFVRVAEAVLHSYDLMNQAGPV